MAQNGDIVNPNDNLEIPTWISVDYFQDILAKDEPNHVKVKTFTANAAIPPGENFTSVMLRIHMDLEMNDGSDKHKTYILKTMLDDDKGGNIVNDMSLFPKELQMYQKYIPAFESLYTAAGKDVQLAPKCLFTDQKDGRINFVFEDLRSKHFRNIDRLQGLQMPEMKRTLQKLAEFHAASVVYAELNGPYPEDLYRGFIHINKSYEFIKESYESRSGSLKKMIAEWGLEDGDKFIEKFPTLEQYWKCCVRTQDIDGNSLNVLTHGDFWSSNIMFNYKPDGTIDETLIVDYQIVKWGSPAEDLLFFITLSATKEDRVKEFDHFVQIYHEHLVHCLKLLKYQKPLPKLRNLHMDMYSESTTFSAFFAVFNHLPIILFPSDKDSNIHMLSRQDEVGEELRRRVLSNKNYSNAMKDIYPFFYHRGLFNFHDYDN